MRPLYPILFLCLLGTVHVGAQNLEYGQGQLIVQLRGDADAKLWAYRQPEVTAWRRLGHTVNSLLVNFDWTRYAEDELRERFSRDSLVISAQLNHRLSMRLRKPNDPRYGQQWQHHNTGQSGGLTGADYNLERAWDITTGGVTVNGDTIVIASIDNGIDFDHEDLQENIWINRDEVPDNGIDDDRNGYVDDRFGWNTALESKDIEGGGGDHGTPVMGQIGAVGNNGRGVTGVNWRVKVMSITNNFDPLESEVIQAYSYALEARQRYDATGGREGAYVVATNASWGRDRAFPSQSPIWCAIYDSLGSHGILNVAAVPNSDVDVDEVGDLPSLCTSEYLIVVTSLDQQNKRVADAARGALSVDLAAYGEGVYTTILGNGYGPVYGTSYAAPAVTGTIGLMYSAPCATFGELAKSDPAATARYVKDVLYGNLRPLEDLTNVTTTGGSLDAGGAVTALMADCGGCQPPTSFAISTTGDQTTDLDLSWKETASVQRTTLQYRRTGTTQWTEVAGANSPYRLSGLPGCTPYELQLRVACGSGTATTEIREIETPGCCRLPDDFQLTALSGGRIEADWSPLLTARSYTLRYQNPDGATVEVTTPLNHLEVDELRNCRNYEFQLRTNCATDSTGFSARRLQKTLGCGVCLDVEYCSPPKHRNEQEWIAELHIPGILRKQSGREAGAYTNFGDLTEAAVVPGGVYPVRLLAGFRSGGFTEDFHLYVDWNQDGVLADEELILQQSAAPGKYATGTFTVPADAKTGRTRMRLIMQFSAVSSPACLTGGGSQFGGEVEDYCLDVTSARGCPPPDSLTATYDEQANATTLNWGASAAPGGAYVIRYRKRTAPDYTEKKIEGLTFTIQNINLCSSYEVQIASDCDGTVGEFRTVYLGDDCVSQRPTAFLPSEWSVYPNPSTSHATVNWPPEWHIRAVALYGADGRPVWDTSADTTTGQLLIPLNDLPTGVYFIRLTATDGRRGTRRLLVW
ncbi:subtilisin family serine protease [Lewinella aquimaris]|uniref:Subtilisin family serine protease n=1 Tax=Neolewinella aquimaris TaxID=1835722 RepID=A0A840E7Z6_9BACT|nr:S8 family peptidase [Neolewinella aquimaris]MBB4079735.1 subtilisin family serine protease [Neolewinella aquimaris]